MAPGADTSDDAVVEAVSENIERYDSARRSSRILFAADDKATAREVLDKINAGELDFAEAAQQYSTDSASAQKGGDVGWDVLTTFVDAYQGALSSLEEGQVSDLVVSDYGIHIVKCTDIFAIPEEGLTSIDQIPTEIADMVRLTLSTTDSNSAFTTWFADCKEAADVQVNDMSADLPYAIDMTPYQQQDLGLPAEDAVSGTEEIQQEVLPSDGSTADGGQ